MGHEINDTHRQVSRYKAAVSAEQARTEEVRLELEKEVHARVIAQDKLQDVKVKREKSPKSISF